MPRLSLFVLGLGLLLALSYPTRLSAQGEIGGGLLFGTDADEIGLGLKGRIPLSPRFDLSPGINLFVFDANDNRTHYYWEVNADVHALFDATPELLVYPLAGLNLGVKQWRYAQRDDRSDVQAGINLGAGAAYYFTPTLAGFSELKFVLSEYDQAVLTLGVMLSL